MWGTRIKERGDDTQQWEPAHKNNIFEKARGSH